MMECFTLLFLGVSILTYKEKSIVTLSLRTCTYMPWAPARCWMVYASQHRASGHGQQGPLLLSFNLNAFLRI